MLNSFLAWAQRVQRRRGSNITEAAVTEGASSANPSVRLDIDTLTAVGRITCWENGDYYAEVIDVKTEQTVYSYPSHDPRTDTASRSVTQRLSTGGIMRDGKEVWRQRVEALARSGLDVRTFAAQAGLNYHSLKNWRYLLNREARETGEATTTLAPIASRAVRRSAARTATVSPLSFIELPRKGGPGGNSERVEICLPSGARVFLPPQCDTQVLASVLDALRAAT